ncbi:cytochrome P450 2A5-like [Pelobates fuscus]|uniref:cytochrome P450 2A5-like n=1 Tax=Pelobates fuscus TaxID=191477 RepID=UPI002FE49BA8
MDIVTLLLIFLVSCVLCFYTWNSMYRGQNLPPGPTPLPILGNLLQLKSGQMLECLSKMQKKYGDVYTLYLGPRRVVVLCGYDVVKEALVDNRDEFGMRGLLPVIDPYTMSHGVIFSNGDRWKELRRFSIQTLKNFGMGKRSVEGRTKEEVQYLIDEFKRNNGELIDPIYHFSQVASNIICSIIFGNRYKYDDPDFRRLMQIINEIFIGMSSPWGQFFDMFNVVMKYLPGPHHNAVKSAYKLEKFVQEKLEIDRKTLNPDCPRNMIDSFLIRMEEEKNNPSSHFTLNNLYKNMTSIFVAGTETLSTMLRHGFLLFLKNPHIKEKVQEEIDRVIGRDRVPEPEDRPSMPYTDAVIHEIQRYANVLPMNLPHAIAKDTQFRGFTIPKGTDVFPVLAFVLNDPKYFPDPSTFNPDRFLDENGDFKKNEAFMAFSAGKRVCLGENLARLELFIFITTLLQHFDISTPENPEDMDISPQMVGFSNVPKPYNISFSPR